ncbi:MAG TPA: carboxypeptidase regulatory-like domain-containing protein [Thermoplasmata archaeon]|nr:carboxypeptidase regulatory-like domain-containing protein [Thermoplasmata archaeon]
MGAPAVSVRCPTCGAELRVVLAPSPPTQWFPCPQCHSPVPVVVPRDLPPLYTWEVFPGLYPALPNPRRPRLRLRRAAQVALVGVALLALVFCGILAVLGVEALGPGDYVVSGTVMEESGFGSLPASAATVVLTTDHGQNRTVLTAADGSFSFSSVPPGGISVNVTKPGYAPVTILTFASPVYNAGTTGLSIYLAKGNVGNGTTDTLSPFPDLETFVASVGSGAVLLFIVAVLGAVAAIVTARSDRPAVGVVGGMAGLLAPVPLYLLALGGAFPILVAATAALSAFGAFATATRVFELYQTRPESLPG